jgi:hypothetical protein
MIIFYPPQPVSTPVVVTDALDSSDRWSAAEIQAQALINIPDGVTAVNQASVYSCKYGYNVQHTGVPLGAALKMTLDAAISSPPAGLVAQVSIDYVSSAESIDQMSDALVKFANPQFKVMTAVIVERTSSSVMRRSFVAYSVILQPDTLGTNTTLFIRGASFDDSLIKSELGFQLDIKQPLKTQLTALASKIGYLCSFDYSISDSVPVCGKLFQPTTFPKILDDVCLQNKIVYKIDGKVITFYSQNAAPNLTKESINKFSFLGYAGSVIWGVGVENYANVKFKTPLFDAVLFDKVTIFNDSQSALFEGFKKASVKIGALIPASYDVYIIRYMIERNDSELCCEVTATNNWLLAQTRIDGILESKIYGGAI